MIETIIQDPEKHETVTADRQGRVNLGVKYAGRDVELVIVESREHQHERTGLQRTIDEPITESERKGMLFVRTFGIAPQSLEDEHNAVTAEEGVDADSVSPSDVNWSDGYLQDPKNVARFVFEGEGVNEGQFPFTERLTAEPVGVTSGRDNGVSVVRYENENGETSAVVEEFVENVGRLFGYDPSDDVSHVRVNPDEGPNPVMFRDPESEVFVAVAPRVPE